ncbi:MAG TPA: HAD family phosphatase [Candidatus Dormibacteraeota bacterium]|nr:HAD family phosphatase [Candidatus Dormibacteraeota bacterium]
MRSIRLPPPAALLFDLDGTLVDTVATRLEAWQKALGQFDIVADRDEVARLIGSDGKRLARVVAEAAGSPIDWDEASAIDRRAGEIYDELNTHPRPLPGAAELLHELDRRHIPWAIATSSMQPQVRASIAALNLPRPPMIVDGSHVEHAKPAPDLLLRAGLELRAASDSTWYVGDSIWDMQAATSAGMPSIGVTTGFANADDLRASGAWLVVSRLTELVQVITEAKDPR